MAGTALVWFPSWHWQTNLTQITALATPDQPVWVVQAGDRTGLINSGREQTAKMTVLPFLQQQGVNQLDWAVALTEPKPEAKPEQEPEAKPEIAKPEMAGWSALTERLPAKRLYHLTSIAPAHQSQVLELERSVNLGRTRFESLGQNPNALSLRLDQQRWLLLGRTSSKQQRDLEATDRFFQPHTVLCWTGGRLGRRLVQQIQPKVAIAYGSSLDPTTENFLQQQGAKVYWIKRDGAIQWQPKNGFRTLDDARASLL
jgi:competence protein ComEC